MKQINPNTKITREFVDLDGVIDGPRSKASGIRANCQGSDTFLVIPKNFRSKRGQGLRRAYSVFSVDAALLVYSLDEGGRAQALLFRGKRKIREMQQYVNHFSHRHPLELSEVHEEKEEKGAICSGCELEITGGSAYTCTKPKCTFILHNACFELPRQVRHKSHPKHPLSLHFSPPYSDREFRCDACGNSGHGFTFHCKTCKFDLHVACASLPEIEHREDHEHPLSLLYSSTPLPATVVPIWTVSKRFKNGVCKGFDIDILF
ncbi:unnamed protein product [Fraxinus pennsylvanica]|uniref:DC1 domain-containing protein n=1 Tax=Fraxinus pennsylvanica TaxID=56036 RepID=A0AAD1ZBP5_9LAMI|nr:unnamed protein product [Fraxinus pennsylvanica]